MTQHGLPKTHFMRSLSEGRVNNKLNIKMGGGGEKLSKENNFCQLLCNVKPKTFVSVFKCVHVQVCA